MDEKFGLCPRVQPPQTGGRYPSLPHWLAQRRQRRELRGEELRLLYVAMTRARDTLILSGAVTEKKWREKWTQPQPVTTQSIAGARSFADWVGLWFANQSPKCPKSKVQSKTEGELPDLRWRLWMTRNLAASNAEKAEVARLKPEQKLELASRSTAKTKARGKIAGDAGMAISI